MKTVSLSDDDIGALIEALDARIDMVADLSTGDDDEAANAELAHLEDLHDRLCAL